MTLQEFKDQCAQQVNYTNFQSIVDDYEYEIALEVSDEAAELYASSKWSQACDEQMNEVYSHIHPGGSTNAHAIKHWTKKPEFKP